MWINIKSITGWGSCLTPGCYEEHKNRGVTTFFLLWHFLNELLVEALTLTWWDSSSAPQPDSTCWGLVKQKMGNFPFISWKKFFLRFQLDGKRWGLDFPKYQTFWIGKYFITFCEQWYSRIALSCGHKLPPSKTFEKWNWTPHTVYNCPSTQTLELKVLKNPKFIASEQKPLKWG